MAEILEFTEQEIPENNPNEKNDIYKEDGGDIGAIMLIGMFIWLLASSVFILAVFILAIKQGDESLSLRWGLVLFTFGIVGGVMGIYQYSMCLYRKYPYRKKIFANGTAYPGIVVKASGYSRKWHTYPGGWADLKLFYIEIKYADKRLKIYELDGNPGEILENPYCTVYDWNGKVIATDFKVRDEYIADNGKEYLLKPKKSKKK